MRVLITGGFGYIGGRLGQLLDARGHTVVLGSRRDLPPPDWLSKAEIARTAWNDIAKLTEACAGVDAVVHLAGMSAQECASDPLGADAFNGDATARLVEAAVSAGTGRFLYVSTAHVYGDALNGVVTENTPAASIHPYGTSHIKGENAVLAARSVDGIVARLSNTIGPPAHRAANCWNLLSNDLVLQTLRTGRMVLRSSGGQRRDFIAMSEACRALSHLLELPATRMRDRTFNIGWGSSLTVLEFVQLIVARFECGLGIRPIVEIPNSASTEVNRELAYSVQRLIDTGFSPRSASLLDQELDSLIAFCRREMGVTAAWYH